MNVESVSRKLVEPSVTTISLKAKKARKRQAKRFLPPPKLSVAEWAGQERVLSSESSALSGKWHNRNAPYLVGPMEAISDPGIEEVIIMSAAQVGNLSVC